MSFEFMYDCTWYKYEDGRIHKQNRLGHYNTACDYVCPVLIDLQNQLGAVPEDVRPIVMRGLLHAYSYGIIDGKKEKIKEFKRVFALD